MSFFVCLLLMPPFRYLRRHKFPEWLSIMLPLFALTIFAGLIVWLFSVQIGSLLKDLPQIEHNVSKHMGALSSWISETFGFSTKEQVKFISGQGTKMMNSMGDILGGAAGSVTDVLLFIGLLPIYIYLIMSYKNLFLKFILMWFASADHTKVREVLQETESMAKSYLVGLLIQITYITVLLGGVLMIFGIKHAILIGIAFAFLNLIPYLGALIGNVLGVLITLASSENIVDIIIVLVAITVVQLIDNNILMPLIVGSKVKVNAMVSIVGLFIAGMLAGISGMFLAMPLLAVMKIVFDRTPQFQQWGVLFGDDTPMKNPMRYPKSKEKPKTMAGA